MELNKEKRRVSYRVLNILLAYMAPHNGREEELMEQWNMNDLGDVDRLCDQILGRRLLDFNELGRQICKDSLLYRILFDAPSLDNEIYEQHAVFVAPDDQLSFFSRVWESLFHQPILANLTRDDFDINEVAFDAIGETVFKKT